MNLIFMIFASGSSKNKDVSGLVQVMPYIGIFSIIPAILCIIFLVISIISTVKYYKNNYSKKLDVFMTILFLILDIYKVNKPIACKYIFLLFAKFLMRPSISYILFNNSLVTLSEQ